VDIDQQSVTLRQLTEANRDEVLAIGVAPTQEAFVSSVADSLEEAEEYPQANPWCRAVYAGEVPVGFVMVSWDCVPQPPVIWGPWFLWKLLIDERHQGKGYGTAVVNQVADLVRAAGGSELLTSYVPGPGNPQPFYARLGFVATGDVDSNGEPILRLDLATSST
jgi:GNAT superfamily N-acetyltransferase